MGLFRKSHEEKLNLAYSVYKPEFVETLFPGGKAHANNVVLSLARIYNINLAKCEAKDYYEILSTYSDVVIRKQMFNMEDYRLMASMMVKHGNIVKSKEVARRAVSFVNLSMVSPEFVLDSEESFRILNATVSDSIQVEKTTEDNRSAAANNLDDPEYGLVPSKPIYAKGVQASRDYLNSLRTLDGEALIWNRLGCTDDEAVEGLIDIYNGVLPSGDVYKTLYVNMYAPTTSTTAPAGFKIKEKETVSHHDSTDKNSSSLQGVPSIKYCRKCGEKLLDGAKVCEKCGTAIKVM